MGSVFFGSPCTKVNDADGIWVRVCADIDQNNGVKKAFPSSVNMTIVCTFV